jgi:hypothetical protein
MLLRAYFSHYRPVRESIAAGITIGTAMLLGYLILWARL